LTPTRATWRNPAVVEAQVVRIEGGEVPVDVDDGRVDAEQEFDEACNERPSGRRGRA
jgi:hypothetical protein